MKRHARITVAILAAAWAAAPLGSSRYSSVLGQTTDLFIVPVPLLPAVQQQAAILHPVMLSDDTSDADEAPVVVNARDETPWFHMDPLTGELDLKYQFERDTIAQNHTSATTTSNAVQETLSLDTHAYIISPNLLDLKLAGTIGLEQDFYDTTALPSRSSDTLLDAWDVEGTILRNESAPLTLYTRRTEEYVTPDFSPSLQDTNTTYGASLQIRSDSLPTELEVYHSDDDQKVLVNDADNFTLSEDVAHWHTDATSLPHQTLAWDYNYRNSDEQESGGGPVRYETHDAALTHVWNFGKTYSSSLSSSLSGNLETGALPYQRFRLDENLQLRHSPTFETHYDYSLDQDTTQGITQTENNLDIGFIHHLYRSLVTSVDAGGTIDDVTGIGEIQQAFGRADFAYHKTVPYGTWLTNLDFGWQWQETPASSQSIPVLNQPISFTSTAPFSLPSPNIDPKSIVIRGTNGVPYMNGRDYVVQHLGRIIQLERVIGGLIPLDGFVLLNYDLLPAPGNTTNTGTAGISGRYEIDKGFLSGLSPYAHYDIQRQYIDTIVTDSTLIPDSYDDTVVGADYRFWRIVLNAEQQWYHSTIEPYNATRFSARYNHRLTEKLSDSLSGNYAILNYYDAHDYITDLSVTATLEDNVTRTLTIRAKAIWLDDQDELFGDTRGLEEQLETEWTHNQTHVYLRLRNANLSTRAENTAFQELDIGITRHF